MTRAASLRLATAAVITGVLLIAPAASAQYEQPPHQLQAGTALTINEPPIAQSDAAYQQAPVTPSPFLCQQQVECRETDFDMRYADGTPPDAEFFTMFTVTYSDPSANIRIDLFGDPNGNANVVGSDTSGRHTLHVQMINHPYDAIQQYGLTVFLNQGSNVAYTIQINSSTTAFPTPFESLNPTATTIPASPSGPPAPAPIPPSDTTPTTAPPGQTLPAPAPATPSSDTDLTLPDSGFQSALAAPAPSLFHKTAAPKPPGPPNDALLLVSLLVLPAGVALFFLWWQRRRRAHEAV